MLFFLFACNFPAGQPDSLSAAIPASTITLTPTKTPNPSPTPLPCLPSGNHNDINDRLRMPGSVAVLCQDAVFELSRPIKINSDRQQIYTEGFPEDEHRAVLRIVSPGVTAAVLMRDYSDTVLSNVIIDGNRPALGYKEGDALVYAGGDSTGQVIKANQIMEPRSWSALHLIEPCSDALVEDNDIGPAGYEDGTWADGISFACTNSIVRNNRIVDSTDGAIVLFAATGSIIEDNLIQAETRTLLGAIHLVESDLNGGDYTGTVVRNNIIELTGAVIRIAVPMGTRTWLCLEEDEDANTIFGATVSNNILRGEKIQYGYIIDGVKDWTVIDNIDESTHIGVSTNRCRGRLPSPPAGFLYNPERAEGIFQPEFEPGYLELALWAVVEPVP